MREKSSYRKGMDDVVRDDPRVGKITGRSMEQCLLLVHCIKELGDVVERNACVSNEDKRILTQVIKTVKSFSEMSDSYKYMLVRMTRDLTTVRGENKLLQHEKKMLENKLEKHERLAGTIKCEDTDFSDRSHLRCKINLLQKDVELSKLDLLQKDLDLSKLYEIYNARTIELQRSQKDFLSLETRERNLRKNQDEEMEKLRKGFALLGEELKARRATHDVFVVKHKALQGSYENLVENYAKVGLSYLKESKMREEGVRQSNSLKQYVKLLARFWSCPDVSKELTMHLRSLESRGFDDDTTSAFKVLRRMVLRRIRGIQSSVLLPTVSAKQGTPTDDGKRREEPIWLSDSDVEEDGVSKQRSKRTKVGTALEAQLRGIGA